MLGYAIGLILGFMLGFAGAASRPMAWWSGGVEVTALEEHKCSEQN